MEGLIRYTCLKCDHEWERPAEKDPTDQCPKCHSDDYDKPRRGEMTKICPVCGDEYPGSVNAHGITGPCSERCRKVQINHDRKKQRTGVYI